MAAQGNESNGKFTLERQPEMTSELVYTSLLNAIAGRTIAPGMRVTESGVARQLQVSKTPVREAFLRLREIGVLEANGYRGSRVVEPSLRGLRQAYEMREALEAFTARTAAKKADRGASAEIVACARRTLRHAENGEVEEFLAADRAFHEEVASAADNPRVVEAIDAALVLIMILRQRDLPATNDLPECGVSHIRIAEAIEDGDGERAAAEMRSHIQRVVVCVIETWDRRVPPGSDGASTVSAT